MFLEMFASLVLLHQHFLIEMLDKGIHLFDRFQGLQLNLHLFDEFVLLQ